MKRYKYRKSFTYDGTRYNVYADTKLELGRRYQKKLMELENGTRVLSGDMKFADWIDRCIDTYKTGQADSTHARYMSRVNHCIKEPLGHCSLKSIRPLQVQECMNLQSGKSKTQVSDIYQALKFFFRMAKANGLIATDPAENLTKPRTAPITHRRALTPVEREKIAALARTDRKWYIYLLMLYCGCRTGEAAAAMGKDITTIDGIPMLHIRGTKTAQSDRFVPIPDELYTVIQNTPQNEYIAQNSYGNMITNRNRLWEGFKYYLNLEMGCKTYRNKLLPPFPVAPDLVPYCLRHEYCTNLARLGVDIRTAQKLMGHSSIELTANVYTNLTTNDLKEAADILNAGHTPGHTPGIINNYKK